MTLPAFGRLATPDPRRARLQSLRQGITPLLATNYLSHFTDHSVLHSDALCGLVDELTSTLDSTAQLTPPEAFILYAACYCHDAGLHHERAVDLPVVSAFLGRTGQTWNALDRGKRQLLVRELHGSISDCLVRNAIRSSNTPLRFALTDDDGPGVIAALCAAHTLDPLSDEYKSLTEPQGSLRVPVLSALLRIADILDESRRRSCVELESARDLPLESRLHWWRLHYVSQVVVEPHTISIWLDYPKDHRPLYKSIVEPLQIPQVEAELSRHSVVLGPLGLVRSLSIRDTPLAQSTSRRMDDALEQLALEYSVERQRQQTARDRLALLTTLQMARPTISVSLDALRQSPESADAQLRRAVRLADHLYSLGGKREAWHLLHREFGRLKGRADDTKLETALRLAELMLEDGVESMAHSHLAEFVPQFPLRANDDETLRIALESKGGKESPSWPKIPRIEPIRHRQPV